MNEKYSRELELHFNDMGLLKPLSVYEPKKDVHIKVEIEKPRFIDPRDENGEVPF